MTHHVWCELVLATGGVCFKTPLRGVRSIAAIRYPRMAADLALNRLASFNLRYTESPTALHRSSSVRAAKLQVGRKSASVGGMSATIRKTRLVAGSASCGGHESGKAGGHSYSRGFIACQRSRYHANAKQVEDREHNSIIYRIRYSRADFRIRPTTASRQRPPARVCRHSSFNCAAMRRVLIPDSASVRIRARIACTPS